MGEYDLDTLQVRFALWCADHGGEMHWRLLTALRVWHAGRGTPNSETVALRHAMLACLALSDERPLEDSAASIGVSLSTARRYLATLEQVFGVMHDSTEAESVNPADARAAASALAQRMAVASL